jgi:hypothetical protein
MIKHTFGKPDGDVDLQRWRAFVLRNSPTMPVRHPSVAFFANARFFNQISCIRRNDAQT